MKVFLLIMEAREIVAWHDSSSSQDGKEAAELGTFQDWDVS